MKKSAWFFLLLALACGKAQKKGSAVDSSTVEMTETEFRESLNDKRIQTPVEPVSDIKNPPPAPTPKDEPQKLSSPQSQKAPGVGVFTTVTGSSNGSTSYNNCTGTLINGDEVITASHCVPDTEKGAQEFCSKMAFTHAKEERSYGCSKVLWSTTSFVRGDKVSPKNTYADILIIKLDGTPKNILSHKLATSPVNNQEKFKLLVYSPNQMKFPNFTSGNDLAELSAHTFHYFFASYSGCYITDNYAPNYPFRAFNCPIVGGNSGASVFNPRGEIQGIVSGCVDPVDKDCAKGNKGGYMTDASCVVKEDGMYQWKEGCIVSGPVSSTAPLITRASQSKRSE